MRLPFSLYDFLRYALPGFIVIAISTLLISPEILENVESPITVLSAVIHPLFNPDTKPTSFAVAQIIIGILVCYLVGFAFHGLIDWLFELLSKRCKLFERYHSDKGSFEKALFYSEREAYPKEGYPEDFAPYTDQFVRKLKAQVRDVFGIRMQAYGGPKSENPIEHTEVFHLCRTAVLAKSSDLSPRVAVMLIRYNSSKLLGAICFLASVGFCMRILFSSNFVEGCCCFFMGVIFSIMWGKYTICLSPPRRLRWLYWVSITIFGILALVKNNFFLFLYVISLVLFSALYFSISITSFFVIIETLSFTGFMSMLSLGKR